MIRNDRAQVMLSVVVLTKNDAGIIKACLESVRWADEIIVVDNNSTDDTLDIVKNYTRLVLKDLSNDFSERRNAAMKQAKGGWVLYLDSDERVLAPLRKEIQEIIQNSVYTAYAIPRRNIIFGREVNYGLYKHDWMIKLFRKNKFKTWVGKIHEYGTFEGELGYTKNALLHLTHRGVDHFVLKSLEWSKIDARLRLEANHPKMRGWRFMRILVSELYNQGIKRKGFFSGEVGIIDSILQVFSLYITYVRLWQLQQLKPLDQVYDEIDKSLIKNGFNYS